MEQALSHFLRNVSFRQLQVFDSIIRTGSFTAAAGELFLTQPTVSAQMKKLEDGVGVRLFDHVGRNIQLTEHGHALKELCWRIFHAVDNFETELHREDDQQTGEINIAGGITSEFFFPLILGIYWRRYPNIKARLTITETDHLHKRIEQRQDDLWLVGNLPVRDDLISETFIPDPLILVCHPEHSLASVHGLTPDDLSGENIVVREEGAACRKALEQFLEQHGLPLRPKLVFNSNEAIRQCVLNGLGIALLSRLEVARDLALGRLKHLRVEGLSLSKNWNLVYPRNKPLSRAADLFRHIALTEGRLVLLSMLAGDN